MAFSPVEFAAAFERLRTHVGAADVDDSALLQLLDFGPKLAPIRENPVYSSYVAEFLASLEAALTDNNLRDLSLVELASLESLGKDVDAREPLLQLIRRQIARQCFFVSKLEDGLAACIRITDEDAAFENGDDSTGGLSEFETFHAFVTAFSDKWSATKKLLQDFAEEWQAERDYVSNDRVYCLFVQNNGIGERSRGKLRALTGTVEERGRSAQNDEVTFDNQLRASDDPIVGVAYQAMAATRRYLRSTGYSRLGSSFYHAHFAVNDKRAVYTGDSIGVATALLAYAQLLHAEALRHDDLLPGDVACTGGIDETGTITPVNGDTLQAKVERAFFSHIKYLALPSENVASARQHLDALQSRYPARQLILLPVTSLSAAVNDHNIVRPEKGCIGEFVAKKAAKYSRMTKVQVPMLMVLAYLLICVIYPKAWPWFDWNPAFSRFDLRENRLQVYNRDSLSVWNFPFDGKLIGENVALQKIVDINGDGCNEVLFIPPVLDNAEERAVLFCCSKNGQVIFKKSCIIQSHLGEDSSGVLFDSEYINIVQSGSEVVIVTEVARSSAPARSHIRMWNSVGNPVGEYVNPGGSRLCWVGDIDGNGTKELFFLNYFNPLPCVSLLILPLKGAFGSAPPYPVDSSATVGTPKGNELALLLFPVTNIASVDIPSGYSQPSVTGLMCNSSQFLDAYVRESSGPAACVIYRIDSKFRVVDVRFTDELISRIGQLVSDAKISDIDLRSYADSLRSSVQYHTVNGWVTEGQLSTRGI